MKNSTRIIVTLAIAIFLFASFYLLTGAISKFTGYFINSETKSDLDLCLGEAPIGLYINSQNTVKTLNEIILKEYLDKAEIVNCAKNNNPCIVNNIKTFPTWIINNTKIERDITLNELKEYTHCKLITEK